MKHRLAIFTTHPIQYQAPWFRALAKEPDIDLDVVFSYVPAPAEQGIGFGKAFAWDLPLIDGYRSRVLDTIRLPKPAPRFWKRLARDVGRVLDDIQPDVAMMLGWQEVSLLQVLLACRRRGVPIVLRGELNNLKERPLIVSALHRRIFALADGFLAIGEANAALYRSAGVHPTRIVTAGYAIDNRRFREAAASQRQGRDAFRAELAIPPRTVCFCFVGKLEVKKRPLDVLAGLEIARDGGAAVSGLVVGSGAELGRAKAFAAEASLPVSFAGFLNQSEMPRAYAAADALVLPSDYGETWGLVVNEAFAAGLPAIVSERIGAAGDLVVDGETGYVVPFAAPAEIASAMSALAGDAGLRRVMGARAQARVESGYSIERAVAATREVLCRVRGLQRVAA